jgi:hypothetical protein
LKCAKKESAGVDPFEPESPNVIVCEGWQDASLISGLLEHLRITNCDVTYPTKAEGANGRSGIENTVYLLSGRAGSVSGVLVVGDADDNPAASFKELVKAFCDPFKPPDEPFTVHIGRKKTTGIYLLPGKGKTGALEHLFLEAIALINPTGMHCIEELQTCANTTTDWSSNKLAKMKLACYVATHCKNDPCCSPAYLWSSKNRVFDLANMAFKELGDFLLEFSAAVLT